MRQGYFFQIRLSIFFKRKFENKVLKDLKPGDAFKRNGLDWMNLSQQKREICKFKANEVCTCYNSGLVVQVVSLYI